MHLIRMWFEKLKIVKKKLKIFVAKQPSLLTNPKIKKKIVSVFPSGKLNMLSEYV